MWISRVLWFDVLDVLSVEFFAFWCVWKWQSEPLYLWSLCVFCRCCNRLFSVFLNVKKNMNGKLVFYLCFSSYGFIWNDKTTIWNVGVYMFVIQAVLWVFVESGYEKQKVYYESISERYPRLDDADSFCVCTCVISAFRIWEGSGIYLFIIAGRKKWWSLCWKW